MKNVLVKIISGIMVVALLAGTFTMAISSAMVGSGKTSYDDEESTVIEKKGISVTIDGQEQKKEITLDKEYKNILEATKEAFKTLDVEHSGLDGSGENSIAGVKSTDTAGWQLFINSEKSEAPPNSVMVLDGDKIEWRWTVNK